MITWKNMDTLASYEALKATTPIALAKAMSGENGAERVKKYSVPIPSAYVVCRHDFSRICLYHKECLPHQAICLSGGPYCPGYCS